MPALLALIFDVDGTLVDSNDAPRTSSRPSPIRTSFTRRSIA
jgi:hypothetical protein